MQNKTTSSRLLENLADVQGRIGEACYRVGRDPSDIRLVAVTKSVDPHVIRELVASGISDIGENRIQIAEPKIGELSNLDIRRHFIGRLQSNKTRKALRLFHVFHSLDRTSIVDSLENHLKTDRGEALAVPLPVFLQVNVSEEGSKSGVSPDEAPSLVERLVESSAFDFQGLMTMAPFVENPEETRPVFASLKNLSLNLEESLRLSPLRLSMGMTNDFEVAVEEGATDVRIGTALFKGLTG